MADTRRTGVVEIYLLSLPTWMTGDGSDKWIADSTVLGWIMDSPVFHRLMDSAAFRWEVQSVELPVQCRALYL